MSRLARGSCLCCLVAGLLLAAPSLATARGDDEQRAQGRSTPDFLFGQPRATLGVRGSLGLPRAGSDLFDFLTRQLTIDKSDLRSSGFATDFGIRLTPRVDLLFGFEASRAAHASEYRDFVDNDFRPIEQSTTLNTANLTAGVRVALLPRGRQISQLAWIPRAVTPYVGAGAGFIRYEFRQTGDFVDFQDLNVFRDVFESKRWTPSAYVSGGVDARLFRQIYLTTDARYLWASGDLGDDFVGFAPMDLAGLRLSAGINFVF